MNWFLRLITFKNVTAITLFPFSIFYRRTLTVEEINHELIHLQQQKELLGIFFYLIYFFEWIFKGYYRISFEIEAYTNESDNDYLAIRKKYAWIKYMRNGKN